jgi:p-aminobenzoyl-glutamate transporter AbgT
MTTPLVGSVTGWPKLILRLEGATLFAASVALFVAQGQQWWLYPALLFVPDIFMLGYLRNTKLGAVIYNIGHSYPAAAVVTVIGLASAMPLVVAIGAIWFGHIGWDRLFGYGLKYGTSFKHTHLGDLESQKTK